MKNTLSLVTIGLLVVLTLSLEPFSAAISENTALIESIKTAFVDKVLPFNHSLYVTTASIISDKSNLITARYTLKSPTDTKTIDCYITSGILTGCSVINQQVISDKTYSNITETAIEFLNNYQGFSNTDTTQMIAMLKNVDTTSNWTTQTGNLKFTLTNINPAGLELTELRWKYSINGVDYTCLEIGFEHGYFNRFSDTRSLYTIGNTEINISKEKAIDIAVNYVQNFSYEWYNNTRIDGLKVNQDKTLSELFTLPDKSNVLIPAWRIFLYLDHTYPGTVFGVLVYVNASSGEVFFCSEQSGGGDLPINNSSSNPTSDINPLESTTVITGKSNLETINFAILCLIAVVIASSILAMLIKIRRKH